MSKCREAFEAHEKNLLATYGFVNWQVKEAWQAAWNAATLNAVGICKYYVDGGYIDGAKMCAEAIEQEQCE